MSKHIRFTALLLAVSLLCNTALPAVAESSLDTVTVVEETVSTTETTAVSSQETTAPAVETSTPTEGTTAPTAETSAPTEETSAPTEETSAPTEETSVPTEETSAPTEPSVPQPIATGVVTCDSSVNIRSGPGTGYEVLDFAYDGQAVSIYEIVTTEEGDWGRIGEGRWICLAYVILDGQEPTEETTAPTEETSAPTEETSAPTEETTAPTEETTAPTEETSAPTEETSAPTEETEDPLTKLQAQLASISVGIQFAEIVPQEMSLTWWAMNCGKMQVDLGLVAENMLAASPEGVILPEGSIPQELLYQPENSTLFLSSPKDLVYLSYVDPVEYQRMTLRFLPSQQENHGFYLIDPIDALQFSPLGSLEAPFRGKLIFHELTGPIQLDCPLFDALSDEVNIENLILECRAEEAMEGGLLAKWVAHTYGGAEWDITLSAPEMEHDAVAILPPLVGSLGSECDVSLVLTNHSGLRVIGSGFLCTQMGMNAKFTVAGLSALPSVTGYAGNVGGLVGTMSAGAELTVLGDCLAVSSVTGATNAGGIIGSAIDPVLSLPMVTGTESAQITAENAGGIIGSLTYSAGDRALALSARSMLVNGRANAGGLVGLLSNENGLLGLTATAEGIRFGADALGCTGSLMGSYLAPQMAESLMLNGETVTDEASLVDLIGNAAPAEETTEPTEESTEPSEESRAEDLAAQIDAIVSDEVVPGEMSLLWWAVLCEKIDIDALLTASAEEDSAILAASDTEGGAQSQPETDLEDESSLLPPTLNFIPENNTLQITSSQDLLLLSYVDPQAYCNLNLDFNPSGEEGLVFDLRNQPGSLEFHGLGSLDAPFAGSVRFAADAGPVLLEEPLFTALSDDAELIQVSLECHATEAMEGGLLARYVVHNEGGNTWQITLMQPETEDGTTVYLPALFGTLAARSNVSLELTNSTTMQVLGNGFLCDVLDEEAVLRVSGLSVIPAVTGFGEHVGGLVGQMKAGSALLVSGEGIALSQVTGSQNVGGIVGTADNPNLSLPAIAGAEGATVCGQNVGALAGSLTLSAGEHTITQNASNLILNGSANSGGLFGILTLNEAALSLTTSLDGLSFGEEALGSNGSIFGTFQASTLENALILNGESISDRTGFEDLAGSARFDDSMVTVEEVQKMMDEIASAELIPGEMSLAWWAVVCDKVTAEEIAAEINGTALPAQEPEQTEATEPTAQADTPEEVTLPQDATVGEAADTAQEDILAEEDVLLANYSAKASLFSLGATEANLSANAEGEAAAAGEAEENIPMPLMGAALFSLSNEESQTEALSSSEEAAAAAAPLAETASSGTPDPTLTWPDSKTEYKISSIEDLVLLSYVSPAEYAAGKIEVDITNGDVLDLTKKCDITIGDTTYTDMTFLGLGNASSPFSGSFGLASSSPLAQIKLNQPLFNVLSTSAKVTANLYTGMYAGSATALLAGSVVSASEATGSESASGEGSTGEGGEAGSEEGTPAANTSNTWNIALRGIVDRCALPLIGTIEDNAQAAVNLSLTVGTIDISDGVDSEVTFKSTADPSKLTVLGGGFLCGTMGENAALTVNLQKGNAMNGGVPTDLGTPKVEAAVDAGGFVGTMESNAKLTVSASGSLPVSDVESTGGNAGGLVGTMGNDASITVTLGEGDLSLSNVTAKNNAGGLVGEATNPILSLPNISGLGGSVITSTDLDAGGIIGKLTVTSSNGEKSYELTNTITGLTVSAKESSGGLFGLLINGGGKYTIKDTDTTVTFSSTAKAGGLIGSYAATNLSDTLILENNTTASTLSTAVNKYGGLIGYVYKNGENGPAYIQISSADVTTNEEVKPGYYGGLIAELSDHGHIVQVGDPSINDEAIAIKPSYSTTPNKYAGSSAAGGLVGAMPSGVLALDVQPTLGTDVEGPTDKRGWVLGDRGNTLVYTTVADWITPVDAKNTNDTGVWGQVLREDQLTGLITVNSDHTVTVKAPASAYGTDNEGTPVAAVTNDVTINDKVDFAAVALRLQLNEVTNGASTIGALRLAGGDVVTSGGITIRLENSIDLSGTGLTGLMQDRYTDTDGTSYPVTILGNGNTITLPSVTVYASENPIAHNRHGLISRASTLTAKNLTIATEGNGYDICVLTKNDGVSNQLNVGMLAAQITGASVDLDGVVSTAAITVSCVNGCNTLAKVAGIIGVTDKTTTTISFTNCEWAGSITDNCPSSTYLGGFLSIASNENKSTSQNVTIKGCKVGGSIKKTAASNTYSPVGALICTLYYGYTTLEIDGLVADGVEITVQGTTNNCGGILSYEWCRTTAWVKNVTIKNCTLTLPTSQTRFGGLIYKGNGICTLGDGTKPGITFDSGNTITGYSYSGDPSGLIFGKGFDFSQGLYLQILKNGYLIKERSVDLKLTYSDNSKKYFDELVGNTWTVDGMGIVSIATKNKEDQPLIDTDNECNTYQNQLTGYDYVNPYTRYYYNLDAFREYGDHVNNASTVTGDVNTPEKMVLLSARAVCLGDIAKYFYKEAPTKITKPDSGDALNLAGYSYYPIPCAGYTVQDVTIVFDNKKIEDAEKNNKQPSNGKTQHALMHTGIFKDGSGKQTLTVNGLTLKGNVGQNVDQNQNYSYGALICGTVSGTDANNPFTLNLRNIELAGIQVNKTLIAGSADTAPLLIANIGSHVTMEMDGVWTKAKDSTETEAVYAQGTYAASSLIGTVGVIGTVGGETGANIQLSFANMALDGRTNANGTLHGIYGTYHTIFTKALFIESFRYSEASTCKGEYNFTSDGSWYTLGQELSNSAEGSINLGRNPDLQFWFYKQAGSDDSLVYKHVDSSAGDNQEASFFASGYRRYVWNKEEHENGGTEKAVCHELDINLPKVEMTEGCGTYSHPYIISSNMQLIALSDTLNANGVNQGWEIALNSDVQSGTLASSDGHTVPVEKDQIYVCQNGNWFLKNGDVIDTNTSISPDVVQKYLRNAYYKISVTDENAEKEIVLGSKWAGLGGASDGSAFSGVIVGDGVTTIRIKPGSTAVTQYGGLIKYSRGSVVKNINIVYDASPNITCSAVPTGPRDASFFGGVVGWCIGGDTIIDGVSVSYEGNTPVLSGTTPHLAAVGGYVGLVGGYSLTSAAYEYGGGVVFKTSVSPAWTKSIDNYFYLNPYVGRVLDGYAMGDGIEVANTDKNYSVPNIVNCGITVGEGTITVSNSDGLWLLSAIVNSGAGNLAGDKAYTLGRTRTGDYSHVGSAYDGDTGAATDDTYWGGVASPNRTTSYLTVKASGISASNSYAITISASCDMSTYGNGFRGIGGSYSAHNNDNRVIKVVQLDGDYNTVTLAQNRKEYLDEGSSWTSIGAGLFVRLYQDSSSNPTTIKNLTLTGSTGITYYNGTSSDSNSTLYNAIKNDNLYSIRLNQVGAGMLASSVANVGTTDLTIENVTLANVNVNSEGVGSVFAGGMIGVIWGGGGSSSNDYLTVTLKDCAYANPTVRGFVDAGGFIGRVRADSNSKYAKIVITYSDNKTLTGGSIETISTTYERSSNFSTVGGLIGCTYYYDLAIQPQESTNAMLTISNLNVKSGYTGNTGDRVFGGGLVGLCYTPKTNCTIQNVEFTGTNTISGAEGNRRQLLGGLIGTLTHSFSWHSAGSASVNVSNIHIAESGSLKLQYTQQAGALYGILNISGKVQIHDIFIGSENGSASVIIGNIKNEDSCNIGGLIGGGNALTNVSLNNIQMYNAYVLLNNNSNKDTRGAALLLGFLESCNGATDPKINIWDVTLRNCYVIRSDKKNRAGFIYGHLNKGNSNPPAINGSNILIENCQLGYATLANSIDLGNFTLPTLSIDGTAAGIIGGNCKDSLVSIKLVGVRVKDCTAPAQNFGTTAPKSDSYVIRADYSKAASNASAITSVPSSTIRIKETEESAAKVLTSDGACFYSQESTTSIAEQIMRDYYGGATCNSYFSIASAITEFASKAGETVTISEKLSTFYAAGDISDDDKQTVPNFPVLVINSNEGSNANSIIQNFITVLTNDIVAPRSISAATYKWSVNSESMEGAFTKVTAASLNVANDGTVSITPGSYDNQRMQFTLLDVSYDDPTQDGASAYHLYIPVIVKKVMGFTFWASAENGSSYMADHYAVLRDSALGSNKDLITSLLTFQYLWTKQEWQDAINSGTNLLWNFDKEVKLYDIGTSLSDSTRLTLVDRNDQDKVYYAEYAPNTISFSSFTSPTGERWSYANTPLCDLLKLEEVAWADGNAKFVRCSEADGPTLRIGTQYYRPANDDDTEYYSIAVGLDENELVEETYYLTFQTQDGMDDKSVHHFLIQCEPRLKNPDGQIGLPTTLKPLVDNTFYAHKNENRVVISNFFTQEITVDTGASVEEMSTVNTTISGSLTAPITFISDDAFKAFDGQRAGRNLWQGFCLYLKDQDGTPVPFAEGTTILVDGKLYSVPAGYSFWLPATEITTWQSNEEGTQSCTVETEFTLQFASPQGIIDQFPERQNTEDRNGIQVYASSSLTLNPDALQRSNLRVSGKDTNDRRFYRRDVSMATLSYNAYDIAFPDQASGLSNLGLNGLEGDSFLVPSAALYNASALKNTASAASLKCTVSLLCKNPGDDGYTVVARSDNNAAPLLNYLSSITISPKVSVDGNYVSANADSDGSFTFTLPQGEKNWHHPVLIDVDLVVRSGSDLESRNLTYANYQVLLTVELLDEEGNPLEGSAASDYIKYTNARIVKELIS